MKHILFTVILIAGGLLAGCNRPDPAAQTARLAETISPVEETALPTSPATPELLPELPPESCPVTAPQEHVFRPPPPNPRESPYPGMFWYGSNALWTELPVDGRWYALPYDKNGYTQKVFWGREGYRIKAEPQPDLFVTGRRLDAGAPPLKASPATNGFHPDTGDFMLVGVEIPTPGCWEITGEYHGNTLSFVIWVVPGTG